MVSESILEVLEGESGIIFVSIVFIAVLLTILIAGKSFVSYILSYLPFYTELQGGYKFIMYIVGKLAGFI